MKMKNRILNLIVLTVCAIHFPGAFAQEGATRPRSLQNIWLHDLDGFQRVLISCDGPVSYTSRFHETSNRLTIFLGEVRPGSVLRSRQFTGGLVRSILVSPWTNAESVTQIDFALKRSADYRIKRLKEGLLLLDVAPSGELPPEAFPAGWASVRMEQPQGDSGLEAPLELASTLQELGDGDGDRIPGRARSSVSLNETSGGKPPDALLSRDRISLDVKGAEVANVLRLLSQQSNLNIIASKDVNGLVTVSLSGVTVKEALDMVLKVSGLDYTFQDDIILVKPLDKFETAELETKVYRLRYLDANNLKTSAIQILSPSAKVLVFYPGFREVDLGAGDDTGVDHGNRSSTLIVTDSPASIRQLDAMVEVLDVPTAQIMIEAKLIEVSPKSEKRLGINWDKMLSGSIFREVILPSGKPFEVAVDKNLEGGGITYGTLSIERFGAVLDFLNSETNTKLVSNPRILAMDNQEAIITVGTTFPIPQISRGVGGQGDQVTFEYRDINIGLRVTPHLADDETITLFVNPDVEEVIGEVTAGENFAPITSKRTVETVVNLKNNETVVIGGLIRENLEDTIQKVWLLGDIPLLGNLFKNRVTTKKQTDLLIFITPRIVMP